MSFRFETILRLNKNKEELLQKDMGQINALIQQQKDSNDFIHEVMENKKHELNQKKRKPQVRARKPRFLHQLDGLGLKLGFIKDWTSRVAALGCLGVPV